MSDALSRYKWDESFKFSDFETEINDYNLKLISDLFEGLQEAKEQYWGDYKLGELVQSSIPFTRRPSLLVNPNVDIYPDHSSRGQQAVCTHAIRDDGRQCAPTGDRLGYPTYAARGVREIRAGNDE